MSHVKLLKKVIINMNLIALLMGLPALCMAMDVTLAWNSSAGATGYKIYYSAFDSPAGPPYNGEGAAEGVSPIDAGNVTQFVFHDLPQTGYRFAITASNVYGESGYSSEAILPPQQFTLSVTAVGSGAVTPQGGAYSNGAVVQLTAIPSSGWVFSGWSGDLNSATNPATIVMDGNKSVMAFFTQVPVLYFLTVSISGQGSVSPSGGNYSEGASVQLTATPSSGWVFSGWSGDVVGSSNPATVAMTSDKLVSATFRQLPPVINVFTATPATICEGGYATLLWDISLADNASIDNNIGIADPVRGSKQVAPEINTTYTIIASNDAGSTSASATVLVGPKIVNVIPHDGAGIQDDYRVPINTSFAVQLTAANGIDITNPQSIKFFIHDGNQAYERCLGDASVVKVTKLTTEPDAMVTKLWVAYHRQVEADLGEYSFDTVTSIVVEANGADKDSMVLIGYEFKTETETEHNAAEADRPETLALTSSEINIEGYDAGIKIPDGLLKGAKVIYNSRDAVMPEFGPIGEIPPLALINTKAVGAPVSLQPPTVFTTPVTVYIPCPRYSKVSGLSVFLFNGKDWLLAYDSMGRVQPDCADAVVAGSRVNHNSRVLSTIEIKVYRSAGLQSGKVKVAR